MVGRWDEPALVHPDERRTTEALLTGLAQDLKVRRDATGISGLWADRPQVAERQGQLRNSLQRGAENKACRVALVARAVARETVWELRLERLDGPLRELMEARPLAWREHPVSTPLRLAWLRQLDEPLRERERRAPLVAAAPSRAWRLFRLVRELEQQPWPLSRGQLLQAKLRVPTWEPEARQVLRPDVTSQPSP
jgi:hypothetical protein